MTVYSSALGNGATCDNTCREVWKDNRTGILWSDDMPKSDNWCRAAGNAESNPSFPCNKTIAQSWCAELGPTPMIEAAESGEVWASGTYVAAKGGLGKTTSISVRWRLPTKYDFQAADINGIKYVVRNGLSNFPTWSATVKSGYAYTWTPDTIELHTPNQNSSIKCIGR